MTLDSFLNEVEVHEYVPCPTELDANSNSPEKDNVLRKNPASLIITHDIKPSRLKHKITHSNIGGNNKGFMTDFMAEKLVKNILNFK